MASTFEQNPRENNNDAKKHSEGPVAKAIEQQTAKLPSDIFLWLSLGSISASAVLQILGKKAMSNFVGQWAPTLLILGLYNKIGKATGSDTASKGGPKGRMQESGDVGRKSATAA